MKVQIVRRRSKLGFTIAEVAIGLTVLFCMIVIFGATVPVALDTSRATSDYSMISGIAHHKIEQIRACGFANINQAQLTGFNIIDITQPSGYPNSSPNGFPSGSTSYSFTSCDNVTSFLPSNAIGVLTVSPDPNAPTGEADDINVTISWTTANGINRSYSDNAIIANV
jgi:hypothetical protein